jgi:putative chitinase
MDMKFPDRFFRTVRVILHPARIAQKQVDGINTIVKVWEGDDTRHLAYILATAKRECRFDLSIREGGRGAGKTYGKRDPVTGHAYYGRGPVQLTWKANYDKMGKALGLDLVNNPDLVLKPEVGVQTMMIGMERGMFTGKKLDDYIHWAEDFEDDRQDAYNARRIVNGLDAAREIEDDYYLFKTAVLEGLHGY